MFPDSVTCEGDEAYLAQFAKISQGDLNPMCAALGNNLLITRYLILPAPFTQIDNICWKQF